MTDQKTGLRDKAQRATDHYIANTITMPITGYTWAQAMRDAKYAESTIDKKGRDTWGLVGVQQQIEAAITGMKQESVDHMAYIRSEHQRLKELSLARGDLVNATRNLEGYGRTYAAYTDNVTQDNKTLSINVAVKE